MGATAYSLTDGAISKGLFVTSKKFRIDYNQTKIFYDQLETFAANFTPEILFLILQKTGWPPNFVISPPITTKKLPIR